MKNDKWFNQTQQGNQGRSRFFRCVWGEPLGISSPELCAQMNHKQLQYEGLVPWWRNIKFCDIMRHYEMHTRLWHFSTRLTQVGNKLLSRINVFQDLLQKFIGKPLFHGGGIQLHVLHTSRLEMHKAGKQEMTLWLWRVNSPTHADSVSHTWPGSSDWLPFAHGTRLTARASVLQ